MNQITLEQPACSPRFGFSIAENAYGRYCIPDAFRKRDLPDLLCSGAVYEPRTLHFLRRALDETGGDIVTGGAFLGDFLPALHDRLAPDARIHSFEPAPLTHAAACHTIILNGLDRVTLPKVAVGAHDGILPLQVMRREGGAPLAAAARIAPGGEGSHVAMVKAMRIDDLVPAGRRVTILQLDLEGFELEALKGAAGLIARNRPILVLDESRANAREAYLAHLSDAFPQIGYHAAGSTETNVILLPDG